MKRESFSEQVEQEFEASQQLKFCAECRKEMEYSDWKLDLIKLITEENRIEAVVKIEEIKCVLRDDGGYPENYKDGDSPDEAWLGEIQAIEDSQ